MKKNNDDKKSDALNKLNSLLSDLSNQKPKEKTVSKIDLAKPKQLKPKTEKPKEDEKKEPEDLGKTNLIISFLKKFICVYLCAFIVSRMAKAIKLIFVLVSVNL